MRIESWFNQDINHAVKVQYLDGNVFSADNAGNLVGVNVFDGEDPYILSGTVSGSVIRSDGATVAVTGALSTNQAYIILPQAAYAVPGVISIVIKATADGATTTLCAVVANVYRASTDTAVDPGTIIPSIDDLIDEIETAVASIPLDYSSLWGYAEGTRAEIDGVNGLYYAAEPLTIDANGKWAYASSLHAVFKISEDDVINVTAKPSGNAIYALLKTHNAESGVSADFSSTFPARVVLSSGASSGDIVAASDCNYLYVTLKTSGGVDASPAGLTINGVDMTYNIRKKIDTIDAWTKDVFVGTFNLPTIIYENSNLNDYITNGNYRVLSSQVASTITNIPEERAGRLYVFQPFSQTGFLQVYITVLGDIYVRRFSIPESTALFEPWGKIIDNGDLQSAIDTVLLYSDSDYARLYSRNLMGMEEDTYYPVEIKDGEKIVFSTSDHSVVFPSDSQVFVRMYDKNKTSIGYVYLNSGLYYKQWTNSTGETVYFLRWISANSTNVMVERGNIVHDYVPYYEDLKTKFTPVEKWILKTTTVSSDPIVVTENIDPDGIYSIRMTLSHGKGLTVTAFFGETWKPVKLVNVNTGKESFAEYQHGEYLLIGTTGATSIKCTVASAAINYAELWLVKYGTVPYIYHGTFATSYLPEYTNITSTALPLCFGLHDGYAYGIDGKNIKRCNLSTNEMSTFYTSPYTVACAMVMDNGNVLYVTSQDTENKMYLLKNGTSTAVHDFYDSTNALRLTPNRLFSLHQYKNIAIVCEYRGNKTPISGYKAFMSEEYGEANTWSTLFDLEDLVDDPATNGAHLHCCVYDPYGDMYWACSGDTVIVDGIWYSTDKTNWYKIQTPRISMKPTEIIPMRDFVLFVSDSGTVNAYKWQRCLFTPGDTLWLDTITMFVEKWGGACPIGAIGYHDPKMNVAYFGYDTTADINEGYSGDLIKHSDVFVTDGYRTKRIYADESTTGCLGVYGDDDYIVISQRTKTVIIHR